MSEFQSAAIHDTVHEHPRPQGILWPEPPQEAKDTLPKDFGWPAMIPGMIVGVVGILLLLGLIPVVKGLK